MRSCLMILDIYSTQPSPVVWEIEGGHDNIEMLFIE